MKLFAIKATFDFASFSGEKTALSRKLYSSEEEAKQNAEKYMDEIVERSKVLDELFRLVREGATYQIIDFEFDGEIP